MEIVQCMVSVVVMMTVVDATGWVAAAGLVETDVILVEVFVCCYSNVGGGEEGGGRESKYNN